MYGSYQLLMAHSFGLRCLSHLFASFVFFISQNLLTDPLQEKFVGYVTPGNKDYAEPREIPTGRDVDRLSSCSLLCLDFMSLVGANDICSRCALKPQ